MIKKRTIEEAQKSGGKKYKEKIKKAIEDYKNLPDDEKHQLHIYYGYGKGKTTAAVGLIMRALGAGKSVAVVEFDKGYQDKKEQYHERRIFRKLTEVGYPLEFISTGCNRMNEDGTFRFKNAEEDLIEARKAVEHAKNLIMNGKQNLLILDEIIAAANYHLIEEEDVLKIIKLYKENKKFEMVMTGHKLFEGLEEQADLITEMRKVKHYFDKGIQAREGIEF